MLHAHLPWVRQPDHERFLEESWLFECVLETYLPLLIVLEGWKRDGIQARIALSISPTLCAMLEDELLQSRLGRRLDQLLELCGREVIRTTLDRATHAVARFYFDRLLSFKTRLQDLGFDLISEFKHHQDEERLELATTSATHALLPLLLRHPRSLQAQIGTACAEHQRHFGRPPSGFWLPECAWDPGLEALLLQAGIRWFVIESSAAGPGAFPEPILTPGGLTAFPRDPQTARLVWSREAGYPGDPRYREFFRDAGFDLDRDHVAACHPSPLHRGFTGIKYHAITGRTPDKRTYRREDAVLAVRAQAAHFTASLRARHESSTSDRQPIWMCPYDAELFGHWWFEGPEFLDAVVRAGTETTNPICFQTPSTWLEDRSPRQRSMPSASTWGEGGDLRVWINERNAWMRPLLEATQSRMEEMASSFPVRPVGLQTRAWDQAVRELMLAQSSDWPFMLREDVAAEFPKARFNAHLEACRELLAQIEFGRIDESSLSRLERSDNLFPVQPAQSFLNAASSITGTPSLRAFSSLDPASSPATT